MFVPSITRVLCAIFIVMMELLSVVAITFTPDNDLYYWVCIGFNLLIVIGFYKMEDASIVQDLMALNVAALIVQVAGLFFYWNEIPVFLYNYPIHLITLLQILRLIIIRKDDSDGIHEDHHWLPMGNSRNMRSSIILPEENR